MRFDKDFMQFVMLLVGTAIIVLLLSVGIAVFVNSLTGLPVECAFVKCVQVIGG